MKTSIITLAIGFLLFELAEHVIFPLVWSIKARTKRSVCGVTGMPGKVGEIRFWQGSEGKILVSGEIWRAESVFPMSLGDKVVIQNVDGLTLTLIPFKK